MTTFEFGFIVDRDRMYLDNPSIITRESTITLENPALDEWSHKTLSFFCDARLPSVHPPTMPEPVDSRFFRLQLSKTAK